MTVTYWKETADAGKVEKVSILEWGKATEQNGLAPVYCTAFYINKKPVVVYTYLYGISDGPGEGPYNIYGTIIEGGQYDWYRQHWNTHQDALQGHARVVAAIESGEELP